MTDDRLPTRDQLDYAPGGGADVFEWQLYTPEQIQRLGADCGFDHLVTCSGFDQATPASADSPRMQVVFEKLDAT